VNVAAFLPDYRLVFCGKCSERWKHGSTASIVKAQGENTLGSVVKMSLKELHLLDPFEGCNSDSPLD